MSYFTEQVKTIEKVNEMLESNYLPTYGELVDALSELLNGPAFHCVPTGHEKHWPQIANADQILCRVPVLKGTL